VTTITEIQTREISYLSAISEAITQCMREDDDVFLVGEDVRLGSVFHVYNDLLAEFGERRIVDSPISEAGLMGLGVGAAATGTRPVVDIMFMDFMGIALDQLVNQAAKMKYMFGGKARLPLTVMTMAGAGGSIAAQHSQSLEAWLCHVPGLKVVMPSGPYEAKGLVRSAIREDNPVVVVCNKWSLGIMGPVPEASYDIPLGQAHVVREGSDVSVVALGRMVHEAMAAATILAAEGIDIEILDPRTLSPLDVETLATSVRKTGRGLVVHEAVRFGGIGGEIAAAIQEEAFDWLEAPIMRIGAPFSPVPFSPSLEKAYVPNADTIVQTVRHLHARRV